MAQQKRTKQFRTTVILSGNIDKLKVIAHAHNISQSAMVRRLIEREYDFLTFTNPTKGKKNLENIIS
jgi:hypothetical protein